MQAHLGNGDKKFSDEGGDVLMGLWGVHLAERCQGVVKADTLQIPARDIGVHLTTHASNEVELNTRLADQA